jgi:hypothetical protein
MLFFAGFLFGITTTLITLIVLAACHKSTIGYKRSLEWCNQEQRKRLEREIEIDDRDDWWKYGEAPPY